MSRKLQELLSPRFFRALGDPTRLAIVRRLAEGGEECTVGQIAEQCSIHVSAVSRHLAVLRDSGILACERRGKEVYYRACVQDMAGLLGKLAAAFGECKPSKRK